MSIPHLTDERKLATLRFNWAIIRYSPWPYVVWCLFDILFIVAPVALGLIEKAIFDTISGAVPASLGLWGLIALYLAAGLARLAASFGYVWGDVTFRYTTGALVRRNLLAALLRRPGALAPPVAPGEAVSRYRDDVGEIADFPLWFPHVVGYVLAFVFAAGIMAQINLQITLVIFLPLVIAIVVTRVAWGRLLHYLHASRLATDAVTGFLGELFGAVQAIKVAGAEAEVIDRFDALNAVRRDRAVRARLLSELFDSINGSAVAFGIGVTLLLAGQAMSAGSFTVGDFALFAYYLWFTTELPTIIGTFIGDYKQQEVSIARLVELIPGEPARVLAEHHPLWERSAPMFPENKEQKTKNKGQNHRTIEPQNRR